MAETKQLTSGKPKPLDWALLLMLALFWGVSFLFIKKGTQVFTPYQVGALRITISAIVFLPVLFFNRFKTGSGSLWALLVVGLLGSGIPSVLFPLAMQPEVGISSSLGAIFNSLVPIFAFLLSIILLRQNVNIFKVLGLFCGSLGVLLLVYDGNLQFTKWGFFAILGSAFYAVSVTVFKKYLQHYNAVRATAVSIIFLLPIALAYVLYSKVGHIVVTHTQGWEALGYIAFLGIVSTGLANIVFFALVQRTGTVFGTTVTYLIPVVAIVVGFLDGEPISWLLFVGLIGILAAVFLVGKD